jgi:hypothetical protein
MCNSEKINLLLEQKFKETIGQLDVGANQTKLLE